MNKLLVFFLVLLSMVFAENCAGFNVLLEVISPLNIIDSNPPVLDWLKEHDLPIYNNKTISEKPVFKLHATDIQTADSGLATWNISFSKEDNSFNSNISGNLDSSQDAVV
ncbi:MAG: hypothetical protein PHV30_11475, partial [Candidatus Margulisbacteria bacterium]|nr:hypothetical protein [Candidatus Margulisiibacteriota bacterium]